MTVVRYDPPWIAMLSRLRRPWEEAVHQFAERLATLCQTWPRHTAAASDRCRQIGSVVAGWAASLHRTSVLRALNSLQSSRNKPSCGAEWISYTAVLPNSLSPLNFIISC